MSSDVCKLCREPHELRESHIIPNAYMRAMKRERNGLLIAFNSLPGTKATLTNESWSERLLCDTCEKHFGRWETTWIRKLRMVNRRFTGATREVVSLDQDYNTLRCFLLSILWRASVSTQAPFATVKLALPIEEILRAALHRGIAPAPTVCASVIRKLVDETRRMSAEKLERLAMGPTVIPKRRQMEGYRFLFAGYVVDFITSKPTNRIKSLDGFIDEGKQLKVMSIDFRFVPEFMHAGRTAFGKNRTGLTTFQLL